jgi:hypothetical protein
MEKPQVPFFVRFLEGQGALVVSTDVKAGGGRPPGGGGGGPPIVTMKYPSDDDEDYPTL